MRRPTPEQAANHELAWDAFLQSPDDETPLIKLLATTNPQMAHAFHDQFVVACFLEDILVELGAPEPYRKQACFDFGQLCFGNDAWAAFDKYLPKCEADVQALTKAPWANNPVAQKVPAATHLLTEWWAAAKRSRGDKGVFPQVFMLREHDETVSYYALALGGLAAINNALVAIQVKNPVEFVLGIDRSAMPGQGLEFADFLTVVWYLDGEFYTGVVNYQLSTDTPPAGEVEPAFRPIQWDNNYWNHFLREKSPIPAMTQALAKANTPRGEA